jgi:hypothetical protein
MPGQRLCISSWGEIDWSAVPVTMPATSRPPPALLIGEESGRLAGAQSTLETTGIGQPRPRDHPTLAWLLFVAGDNAELLKPKLRNVAEGIARRVWAGGQERSSGW